MTPAQFQVGVRVRGKDWEGHRVDGFIVGGVHSPGRVSRKTLTGVTVKIPPMRSIIDGRPLGRLEYRVAHLRDVKVVKES